jgi:hypothetical protein
MQADQLQFSTEVTIQDLE